MKVPFRTIEEALAMPRSGSFRVSGNRGRFDSGNKVSFFRNNPSFENLTFDVSNNKVLAHMSVNGTIKALSVYRASYPVDSILPGVWWFKDITTCGPYYFTLTFHGKEHDLAASYWPFATSYLDNIFPCTQMKGPGLEATLLVYPPTSENGALKLRGVFYGLHLKNTGKNPLSLQASLVEDPPEGESYIPTTSYIFQPDENQPGGHAHVDLGPGETAWLPYYIDLYPGTEELNHLQTKSSLQWLAETWLCFRNVLGRLTVDRDVFLHEYFERCVLQCRGSIGMTTDGQIAGSNWGTYPATRPVWLKDMYYSYLPFFVLDPEFFKTGILWFLKRSIRPGGRYFDGDVSHSLVNALTPVVLAGLYFASTGDSPFFTENPDLKPVLTGILKKVLRTRHQETGLFPSDWISDVPAIGDYHTGSNVIAWYAFRAASELMQEVYGEKDSALLYAHIAMEIRESLEARNRKPGGFGDQYVEGTDRDGEVPVWVHDGEENDVTLMPVYGYTGFDDRAYGNFARFAFSEANLYYQPECHGIRCDDFMDIIRDFRREDVRRGEFSWEEYFRTHPSIGNMSAPCLVTNIASIENDAELFAPDGPLALLKQHTDLDGSLWWWSYPGSHENPRYEQPVRFHKAGKSAWAAGSFTALFISEILGIGYRGPDRALSVRPLNALGSFGWKGFRCGAARFTIAYTQSPQRVSLRVKNLNPHAVSVSCELPIGGLPRPKSVYENGFAVTEKTTAGRLFESTTVRYVCEVSEKNETLIEVIL